MAPPRPNPSEALTSWCATIVDRDWRPAHGIPSSLNLDPLPTTILHQPPIPPSPTYNMTLCSYKADRPHDPILKSEECVAKSARHAPPCKSLLPASRHSRVLISLTPPQTEPRAQHRRRARTGRPAARRPCENHSAWCPGRFPRTQKAVMTFCVDVLLYILQSPSSPALPADRAPRGANFRAESIFETTTTLAV